MVGWRLLKDILKRLWILGFLYRKFISHPHLYPQFAFDTPVEKTITAVPEKFWGWRKIEFNSTVLGNKVPDFLMPNRCSHSSRFALRPATPSNFQPSQTPPTPYPHLLAMGLPSTFAYYFAQRISLRKAPLAFWNVLGGAIYKFWEWMRRFVLKLMVKTTIADLLASMGQSLL